MKSVVFVVAMGNHAYFDHTLPRLAKFARMLESDFHVAHTGCGDAPATWMKMALMHRYNTVDRLIILDADILPNFGTLKPEDLRLLTAGAAAMAPDQGNPVRNARFSAWCERHLGTKAETGGTYFNAGVMSFSGETVRTLTGEFAMFQKTPDDFFHEQDFINFVISKCGIPVVTLPQTMNWIAPQFREASLQKARLIHCAGGHKKLIPSFDLILPR